MCRFIFSIKDGGISFPCVLLPPSEMMFVGRELVICRTGLHRLCLSDYERSIKQNLSSTLTSCEFFLSNNMQKKKIQCWVGQLNWRERLNTASSSLPLLLSAADGAAPTPPRKAAAPRHRPRSPLLLRRGRMVLGTPPSQRRRILCLSPPLLQQPRDVAAGCLGSALNRWRPPPLPQRVVDAVSRHR